MMGIKNNLSFQWKVALGIILFIAFFIFFIKFNNKIQNSINLQNILDNPDEHIGVVYQTSGRIVSSDDNNFFIYIRDTESNHLVKIFNDGRLIFADPRTDSITIRGVFNGEYFIPINVRIHKFLFMKYVLSIIGLFIFLYIFLNEWKLTLKGFESRGIANA